MNKEWKKRSGIVYSTNPDFQFGSEGVQNEAAVPPEQQQLYVRRDRKNRKGKTVTLVEGFTGREEDLKSLGSELKRICGTGGSVSDGAILIQGDFVQRIIQILVDKGFKVKRSGG